MIIAHISQQRTNGVGELFSSPRTFFHKEGERDCFEQSLFRQHIKANLAIFVMKLQENSTQISNAPSHVTNAPSQIPKTSSMPSPQKIFQVRQPKHQVCHPNQKNMQTKTPFTPFTPSVPSQSKEYANQGTI